MSDLENLRFFVEVVESGGFNRAAKRLGISKSIVSRRIAQIEADLGVRLLSRSTRGIVPTDAGIEFKERGERILADYEAAREEVARRGGDVAGTLRLSVPLSFGLRHVAPVLTKLAQRYPRLEFDVSYNDRVVDLIGERFEAAIRLREHPGRKASQRPNQGH
jgi:DNA-binding transcriptional LysR family regulator